MGAIDFAKLPHIGESVRRKEDYRFLTGAGQYTDDIVLANMRQCGVRALAARPRQDPQHRQDRCAGRARRGRHSSTAKTWPPTRSAACPAAG